MRLFLIVPILALAAAPASADAPKPREACRADVERLCAGIKPGDGRIAQCFKEHRSEISEACRAAVKERRAASKERRAALAERRAAKTKK